MGVLTEIQNELKAPKNRTNKFGGYKYRSCEDILEAVKPILLKHDATVTIRDDIEAIGGRVYVKATVTFWTASESTEVTAYAREAETKKGMDDSQITGTASSYARKYALNGLFLIDDTKDPDTDEYEERTYTRRGEKAAKQPQEDSIRQNMEQYIADNYDAENMSKILAYYNVTSIAQLNMDQLTKVYAQKMVQERK